jgi:choline dehydrogenase-like flavoprotein
VSEFDIIVIGAGAAGGIVAAELAQAGKTVLLLERGPNLAYADLSRDHLRNQRLGVYGNNAGPSDGHPRVAEQPDGSFKILRPHEHGYHNNAAVVGGGTRVFGAQAWRFMPQDFRMASLYGIPEGSSLADWPIEYDDLEPDYERAESEIGVAGDAAQHRFEGPRRKPFPMPATDDTLQRAILHAGAQRLGIPTQPVPMFINTVAFNHRAACVRCGMCNGFACPTDAKNGAHNTMIPLALSTGRCLLETNAQVERVIVDAKGKATGIAYYRPDGSRRTASAKIVVISAGAIESARLLLNSATADFPHGLGNRRDLVGRNLQGHAYFGAQAIFPQRTYDGIGPGPAIATCRWVHGNPGIVGGAMLANEFIKLPVIYLKGSFPPDLPRWGLAAKRWMRDTYARAIHVQGPVQEIPSPQGRVTIDPTVRDRFGIPVARFSGTQHPQTLRSIHFIHERCRDWLGASGAQKIWGSTPQAPYLSAGQHQAGTCRMGNDPASSVCDSYGAVHEHENLFVVDASLHVTNGGFNPALTIMALAFRSARKIAATIF